MFKRLATSAIMALVVVSSIMAMEAANLCFDELAGLCQTQRQWQAGYHCHVDNGLSNCSDVDKAILLELGWVQLSSWIDLVWDGNSLSSQQQGSSGRPPLPAIIWIDGTSCVVREGVPAEEDIPVGQKTDIGGGKKVLRSKDNDLDCSTVKIYHTHDIEGQRIANG